MGLLLSMAVLHANRSSAQSSVHRFGTVAAGANRAVELKLLGTAPSLFENYFDLYVIEASTDLLGWMPWKTLVRTNRATNSIIYSDETNPDGSARFYRTPTNHFCTALAQPTGPYVVGRMTRLISDPSRTNRYQVATNSSFMLTVWYPAEPSAGALPEPYISSALAPPLSSAVPYSPGDDSNRLATVLSP